MGAQPKPSVPQDDDLAAGDVLRALGEELSRMAQSGRALETLVARLAAPALNEDGVVEGLQAIDELIQCMGELSRFVHEVAGEEARLDASAVKAALNDVKLIDLRDRLVGQSGGDADASRQSPGDVDMF